MGGTESVPTLPQDSKQLQLLLDKLSAEAEKTPKPTDVEMGIFLDQEILEVWRKIDEAYTCEIFPEIGASLLELANSQSIKKFLSGYINSRVEICRDIYGLKFRKENSEVDKKEKQHLRDVVDTAATQIKISLKKEFRKPLYYDILEYLHPEMCGTRKTKILDDLKADKYGPSNNFYPEAIPAFEELLSIIKSKKKDPVYCALLYKIWLDEIPRFEHF